MRGNIHYIIYRATIPVILQRKSRKSLRISTEYATFAPEKQTGCSSARLEYTSGGRVVAGSNPVIPTRSRKELGTDA